MIGGPIRWQGMNTDTATDEDVDGALQAIADAAGRMAETIDRLAGEATEALTEAADVAVVLDEWAGLMRDLIDAVDRQDATDIDERAEWMRAALVEAGMEDE